MLEFIVLKFICFRVVLGFRFSFDGRRLEFVVRVRELEVVVVAEEEYVFLVICCSKEVFSVLIFLVRTAVKLKFFFIGGECRTLVSIISVFRFSFSYVWFCFGLLRK